MKNVIRTKWMRAVTALMMVTAMTTLLAPQASARILFQDDDFHDIVSEGILINSDDTVGDDLDVTLQMGNDGTDATMVFDDGTGDVTFATAGGDFDFSDDNITTTGALLFSAASEFHMREVPDEAAAACTTIDELVLDTTENRIYVCTATGTPGTWVASDASSLQDFESVYATDAGNNLVTSNGDFTINTGSGDFVVSSANWSVDAAGAITGTTVSDGAGASMTGGTVTGSTVTDGSGASMTGGTVTGSTVTDGTATLTGGALTGATGVTSTGTVNFSGAGQFRVREEANVISGTTACANAGEIAMDTGENQLYVCTVPGTDTWVPMPAGDADTLDGLDADDFLRSNASDNYTSGTLTFDSGTTVDVDGEFDASGATEFHMREEADESAAACTTAGELVLDTTENRLYVCTATGTPGTWSAVDAINKVDAMTFEPEYPDAVIYQDGSNNRGRLDALFDDANDKHHYRWTTRRNTDQDIDIRFRYELPADFDSSGNLTLDYRTATALTTDNTAEVTLRNDTDDATCGTAAAAASTTWGTLTITGGTIDGACTGGTALDAGDVVEVIIKLMADDTNDGFADVGTLKFDYNN